MKPCLPLQHLCLIQRIEKSGAASLGYIEIRNTQALLTMIDKQLGDWTIFCKSEKYQVLIFVSIYSLQLSVWHLSLIILPVGFCISLYSCKGTDGNKKPNIRFEMANSTNPLHVFVPFISQHSTFHAVSQSVAVNHIRVSTGCRFLQSLPSCCLH